MVLMEFVTFIVTVAVVAMIFVAFAEEDKPESDERPVTLAERRALREESVLAGEFEKDSTLSAVPWLNRQLKKLEDAPALRGFISQAGLEWTLGRLVLMCLFCFTITAFVVEYKLKSLVAAVVAGLLFSLLPILYVLIKRKQRFAKFEEELPPALDMIVSALRAGHSFNAAIALTVHECEEPVKSELRICADEQNYGLPFRTAMENMTTRMPLQDLRIAVTAILIQKETGGNLAEVLNKCSGVIRERFRLQQEIRVRTAHGRITGWVISCLPVGLLAILYLMNPALESILWTKEIGIKLLWGAAGSMSLGILAIRKIMNVDI